MTSGSVVTVVVATWNLENLFRPGAESGPSGEVVYAAKLTELARVISELSPDVLAVQEVGDPAALDDLAGRLDGEWRTAVSAIPDGRGIRVGFLSRRALQKVDQVHAFPVGLAPIQVDDTGSGLAAMARGALKARIRIEGRAVDLITCHLKSKLLTFPGGRFAPRDEDERARFAGYALYRRAAEAVTLRAHANRVLDGDGRQRSLVVLGDLNDEPQAATTQILLGPPARRSARPGLSGPTRPTGRGCGTSRR
jgi:endonuclease/exonuclease/phosphatase family metal-dependent hydrolase